MTKKALISELDGITDEDEVWLIAPGSSGARGTAKVSSVERMPGRLLLVTDSVFEVKGLPVAAPAPPTESPIPQPRAG